MENFCPLLMNRLRSINSEKPEGSAIFSDCDFPICLVRKTIFQGTGADMEEARKKPIIAGETHMENCL